MNKPLLALLSVAWSVSVASAAVTLSFNSTTDGFTAGSDATSMVWDPYNGGSLALTTTSGWRPQTAYLDIATNPVLLAELQSAQANGGILSYTLFVEPTNITGGTPDWFETVYIGNSNAGWDQNTVGAGTGQVALYGGDFPFPATISVTVSMPILNAPAAADSQAQFGSGWYQVNIGLNSGDNAPLSGYSGGKIYLDNFSISANPVPEPTAALLGLLSVAGMLRRQRA